MLWCPVENPVKKMKSEVRSVLRASLDLILNRPALLDSFPRFTQAQAQAQAQVTPNKQYQYITFRLTH
jgi:hypothetical protein